MSSSGFSNANTGDKPADPYGAANADPQATLSQKVEALSKFANNCKFGMMTTRDTSNGKLSSRCMAVAGTDTGGLDLIFTTNTESHKTDELAKDSHTNISFVDSSGQWASFAGDASIETDRAVVSKYYNPALKAWLGDLGDGKHDGSENDPRIGIIRVKTDSVSYCLTDMTVIGRMAEIAKGAVTGEPASINKLRFISEAEVLQWRASESLRR
ncbi:BLI-3 blue-light-inducible Bli-3 protein [Apiospora hydei]|uniref:BLI-3 blue-light-inducible Bli-3 protein n=1 Tax=Apiospora hydei TaxID=1337664 RepID=A0ABR1UTY3_9PEZI